MNGVEIASLGHGTDHAQVAPVAGKCFPTGLGNGGVSDGDRRMDNMVAVASDGQKRAEQRAADQYDSSPA